MQIIACTATVSSHFQDIMQKVMKNPIGITPKREVPVLLGIKQFALELPAESDNIQVMRNKIEELQKIFTRIIFKQCLLFTSSQAKTETYGNYLKKAGWKNEVINGSQDQEKRIKVLKKLMDYKCRILITTDLMARGIDIENINLVINLDLPYDGFTYLHRIGRAGRFGTHGIAITFLNGNNDVDKFRTMLGEIGGSSLQVPKFPSDKLNYNFWSFNETEQDSTLEMIEGLDKEDCDEINGNVDENLLLLEISKSLVDDQNAASNCYDLNALLDDYEKNRKVQLGTCEKAEICHANVAENIFTQAIKDLNLYEDEKDQEIKSSKEKRHVVFVRRNNEEELEISSSSSETESSGDEQEETHRQHHQHDNEESYYEVGYSQREPSYEETNSYAAYNDYVANNMDQWRNIFNFQLASIQNYVMYRK